VTYRSCTMRRASWLAVAAMATLVTATLGLAQAAFPSIALAPNTQSTTFAGYNFTGYIGVPGNVSAIIVVPKLNCAGTPAAGSAIYVGVGIASVNSYARLELACTSKGVARYSPSFVVDGTIKNAAGSIHAGDAIQFAVSQSDSQVADSVIDLTHKFSATRLGNGSGTSQGITAGAYPVTSGSTILGVPKFGTVAFSTSLVNGYPLGASGTGFQADDLYASSTLQIKTTYSTSNKEAFSTVFQHS
jgi:hypothetical protein